MVRLVPIWRVNYFVLYTDRQFATHLVTGWIQDTVKERVRAYVGQERQNAWDKGVENNWTRLGRYEIERTNDYALEYHAET